MIINAKVNFTGDLDESNQSYMKFNLRITFLNTLIFIFKFNLLHLNCPNSP